jgi:hypothetical protein
MTKRTESLPLIEEIEGREQDDRAALRSAWLRIQYSRSRRCPTDLHVRELIFHVFARDKSGIGVQLSHEEVAKELEVKERTARHIIDRAAIEFGLLEVKEQRYVTGGQSANRYSIDWPVVRSINAGLIEPNRVAKNTPKEAGAKLRNEIEPGDTGCQGPDTGCQGPDTGCHPYKDIPRILPRISPTTHCTKNEDAEQTRPVDEWQVVVSDLVGLGMVKAQDAITAARSRELSKSDVDELIKRWERLRARQRDVTVAWLYRWLMGLSCPPDERDTQPTRRSSLASDTTRAELIRSRVVKEQRLYGASEEEISRKVREAMDQVLTN